MIKIENLSKTYEKKNIFHALSLTLYDTQIYALVGVNGIGKTTFLNSITQSAFRTNGNVLIDSLPTSAFESKYHFFFIPDHKDMFLNLSGNEYLSFIINIYKCDFTAASTAAHKITSLLKISADLNKPLSSYSLGMKQKIYLTGALISGATNLILDEPFNGLDPESCEDVLVLGTYISVGDDCIAIKSGKIYMAQKYNVPTTNMIVRQCCIREFRFLFL